MSFPIISDPAITEESTLNPGPVGPVGKPDQIFILETDKEVKNAYDALLTDYQAVQLQEQNVQLARESVRLATERYQIGSISYIELQNATNQATEAERGLIEARYAFMQSLARLQGAVGRPIPIPGQ